MERSDWSVGQCLQTSNEASIGIIGVGFRKIISSVKSAHFQNKNFEIFISKWNFEINFQCERGHTECCCSCWLFVQFLMQKWSVTSSESFWSVGLYISFSLILPVFSITSSKTSRVVFTRFTQHSQGSTCICLQ